MTNRRHSTKSYTTEEWLELVFEKHPEYKEKFDYSKSVYVNANTNIIFICKKCGKEFKQLSNNHLNFGNCPHCNKQYHRTWEELKTEMSKVHNGKYTYPDTDYKTTKDKITIVCPEHGEFKTEIASHLFQKTGCPKCGGKLKSNKEEYLAKLFNIFPQNKELYDYSKFEYEKNSIITTIICKTCGKEFSQRPKDHLIGSGCPYCAGKHKTTESYLEGLFKKFPQNKELYDYSNFEYKSAKTKTIIICRKCGKEFSQTPDNHLLGKGCPDCKRGKLNNQSFIERANKIHDFKYIYNKVDYVNNNTKVIITCPKHGDFEQRPRHHLNGYGCPDCSKSKGEIFIAKYLTENNINFEREKSFPDLRSGKGGRDYLRFDFWLPDYNLVIEYQGGLHYNKNPYRGGEGRFEQQLKYDQMKRDWCELNKIQELEINYKDFDRMEEILHSILL